MVEIFILKKYHSKYRYQFYEPETAAQWFGNPPCIDVFQNCRDIRHMIPSLYITGMPDIIELQVSSEPKKGYKSWLLTLEDGDVFSYEASERCIGSGKKRRREKLELFTKYLIPLASPIELSGQSTRVHVVYIKIKIIKG
ncbi:MAG: hypothetical protein CFE26_02080 [Verrucomicrobiales bacterium VVV1]|nr:MAG: hypothetical protein CFE26_02080 [Verrucomicrobiales bacterium VVV1]